MALAKATTKALESCMCTVVRELAKCAKAPGKRGARDAFYELRQSLIVLTKSRAAFEPMGDITGGSGDLIGFQRPEPEDDEDEDGSDALIPEARTIGFRS